MQRLSNDSSGADAATQGPTGRSGTDANRRDGGRLTTTVVFAQVERAAASNGDGANIDVLLGALATTLDAAGDHGARVEAIEYYARLGLSLFYGREPTVAGRRAAARLALHLAQALFVEERFRASQEAIIQGIQALDDADNHLAGELFHHLGTIAHREGDSTAATRSFRLASESFVAAGAFEHAGELWYQLGRLAEADERWKDAHRAYQQAAKLLREHSLYLEICERLVGLAERTAQTRQLRIWLRAIISASESQPEQRITALVRLAAVSYRPNAPTAARRHARRAVALIETRWPITDDWETTWQRTEQLTADASPVIRAWVRADVQGHIVRYPPARRTIATRYQDVIDVVVATVQHDAIPRGIALAALHVLGHSGTELRRATEQLWAGVRDLDMLSEGLGVAEALVMAIILDKMPQGQISA